VTLTIQIQKLPAGTHAMHLRTVGRCDAPDFASAGPILNPERKAHGAKNANGQEAGDLPNLTVQHDGTILAQFQLPALTLQQGQPNSVFQPMGSALVIDQRADDDMSQPSGNAGPGIACAVLVPGHASASGSATPTAPTPTPMHPSATPTIKMSPTPTPTM
jgi:Cu-Zn family superoxide dismutase